MIACIEDQDAIDRILDHLRQKEQELPSQPLLAPPTRAPPGTLSLYTSEESHDAVYDYCIELVAEIVSDFCVEGLKTVLNRN